MKAARGVFFSLLLLFILPLPNDALEVETHQAINRYIARETINGFSLDSYLKNQVGFQRGVREEFWFQGFKDALRWIAYGGVTEDKPPGFFQIPYLRSTNHFHDPINNQGFSGLIFGFIPPLFLTGKSSIQWSQEAIGGQSPGGYYSWFDARDYYYKALTSTVSADRDRYFAETFRGLGQLMHLVQDLSVPAHARNQFHVGYDYEAWVNNHRSALLANPPSISFDPSLLNQQSPLAGVPFANIFDSEKYTGSNPEITVGSSIGLSEYSNANFFSYRTIFQDYPHPKKENTNAILIEREAEDGQIDKLYYISGYQSEKLALYSYFANAAPDLPGEWQYTLDDTVHEDYAQKLVPRAVGYSAGFLNYFFRGSIAITLPDKGVYAQTGEDPNQGFNKITLNAQNISPEGEEMTDGSIELVVKYRLALDDPFQNYPVDTTWQFTYVVVPELNGTQSIPRESPVKLEFNLGQPIPLWATDLYLQVVYKGKLGLEDEGVAVGFKDISEPTPIDMFNNMDRICINGAWYVAGSPEAIAQVDWDHDGIAEWNEWDVYSHDLKNIYIRFSSSTDPKYASSTEYNLSIPSLSAGQFYIRQAFVLSDYQFSYGYKQTVMNADGRDPFVSWNDPGVIPYQGLKNQTEYLTYDQEDDCALLDLSAPCGTYIRTYPTFHTYRDQLMWFQFTYENRAYPVDSMCE